jgi:putative DNA primase/helicase
MTTLETVSGEVTASPPSKNHNTTSRLPVNFDSIPTELKQTAQWVLWRYEVRDGKQGKVPYQPNGRKASSTDASTWSTFEAVKAAYEQGSFSGVGFALANGFAGVDFDHCRDPSTGEIDAWAKAYLNRLSSYSEVSPSGECVHCILRGSLLKGVDGRRKALEGEGYRPKAAIEMYSASRYFTVTGDRLG